MVFITDATKIQWSTSIIVKMSVGDVERGCFDNLFFCFVATNQLKTMFCCMKNIRDENGYKLIYTTTENTMKRLKKTYELVLFGFWCRKFHILNIVQSVYENENCNSHGCFHWYWFCCRYNFVRCIFYISWWLRLWNGCWNAMYNVPIFY